MDISEHPIIVQYESQRCIRGFQVGNKWIAVMESIGIDRGGKRWRFCRDQETDLDTGLGTIGENYDFVELEVGHEDHRSHES